MTEDDQTRIAAIQAGHDSECEAELTSHGYTPCRCDERLSVWHFGSMGSAECRTDAPNMRLTEIAANVTCRDCFLAALARLQAERDEARNEQKRPVVLHSSADGKFLTCSGCQGPHRFDTSVPSVVWNAVVRAAGLPDYLCTTCVVEAFARVGRSFTATLYGEGFSGVPIEVRVNERIATDAHDVQEENNTLRCQLRAAEAARDEAQYRVSILDLTSEAVIRSEQDEAQRQAALLPAVKEKP